jgi:hypothetical protein
MDAIFRHSTVIFDFIIGRDFQAPEEEGVVWRTFFMIASSKGLNTTSNDITIISRNRPERKRPTLRKESWIAAWISPPGSQGHASTKGAAGIQASSE